MLTYKRPADSAEEKTFINKWISNLPKAWVDDAGNIHVQVGKNPKTLFSCHTDTVHRAGGMQEVLYDPQKAHIFVAPQQDCLGADDGAGIWIMREMILANKPGYYIFHRGEEIGGIGSSWISRHMDGLVKSFDRAIAFDRKGTTDIINSQRGGRCCSMDFVEALSAAMEEHGIPGMKASNGSFTDTANYIAQIPECTNLSVGYYHQHSSHETQDLMFIEKMRKACIALDWDALPVKRKAEKNAPPPQAQTRYTKDWWDANGGKGKGITPPVQTQMELEDDLATIDALDEFAEPEDIMYFVMKRPAAAARALLDLGVTYSEIKQHTKDAKEHLLDWM